MVGSVEHIADLQEILARAGVPTPEGDTSAGSLPQGQEATQESGLSDHLPN
jgi:hypothetical protein